MGELFKRFCKEEEGVATVEIVIIIGVLVAIALLFREQLIQFVSGLIKNNFNAEGANSTKAQMTSD